MIFKSSRRLLCPTVPSFCLVMSILLMIFIATVLLNSSFQSYADNSDVADLVEEFRDIFPELLEKAAEGDRSVKYIRDTSKINGRQQEQFGQSERDRPKLSPLYPCNYFDATARLCVNIRQLGTTLTIGANAEGNGKAKNPIHWYRVYKVRGQTEQKSMSFVKFSRFNLPWNINIGGENNELRISPITETDFSYNFFLAILGEGSPEDVQGKDRGHFQLMMFRIEPISIDMGHLYHGEEITINVRSFMEMPAQSIQYEWSRIGSDFEPKQNLPSNMKLSRDGSSMVIKEHQSYGDMVLTCAIYTNKNFTVGRRNFFLKDIVSVEKRTIKFENAVKRKRRYLDDFYVQPSRELKSFSKYRRDLSPTDDDDSGDSKSQLSVEDLNSLPLGDFYETSTNSQQQSASDFTLFDNPRQTVLNFYGKPSSRNTFTTENEMFEIDNEQFEQPPHSSSRYFEKANVVVESDKNQDELEYSTVRNVEEKPTFEDKESMLMADCYEDSDCGINAVCFQVGRTQRFCKCLPHYRGNGLFCWLF